MPELIVGHHYLNFVVEILKLIILLLLFYIDRVVVA